MPVIPFDFAASRDEVDIRWGGDYEAQRFHVKLHPNGTRSDKNPCIIYVHGGGAAQNDGRLPFTALGNGNFLFDKLRQSTKSKFVMVGFTAQQNLFPLNDSSYPYARTDKFSSANANSVDQTFDSKVTMPVGNEPLAAGALFEQLKVFIMVLKSRASEFGIDPDKIFIMGSSFGGVRCLMSQITGPLQSDNLTATFRSYYGLRPGVDSTVKGIINHYCCPDFRNNTDIMSEFSGGLGSWADMSINDPIHTQKYTGVMTRKQLWALPAWHREQLSLLWYLEQNHPNLKYLPPVYHFYEFIGQAYPVRFRGFAEGQPTTLLTLANGGVVNGGSGYTASQTISVNGGTFTEKAQCRIVSVVGGVVQSVRFETGLKTGSYRNLPNRQQDAVTGLPLATFGDSSCTYDAANGDTASAGSGLVINIANAGFILDERSATSAHGGLAWPAIDPHDDVIMRMIDRTVARYDCPVKFRYCTPTDGEIVELVPGDPARPSMAVVAADMENWMMSCLANNPLVGPGPIFYGDYYGGAGAGYPKTSVRYNLPQNWVPGAVI